MHKGFEARRKAKRLPIRLIIIASMLGVLSILGGIFAYRNLGYYYVAADEVAVVVNNLTGGVKTIDRAGVVIYIPFLQNVYTLDKREQILVMSSANITPAQPEGNPLWVKAIDGGDVSLDMTIHYHIMPVKADFIIQDSGFGNAFKEKWLYDYGRAICRYNLGELRVDDFPFAERRAEKANQAKAELNKHLNPHGVYVITVNIQDYRYYREYAEQIHERRLADKEVQEQIARASAARENQRRVIVEETKKMDVEVARFRGDLQKREIDAEAKAEAIRHDAEAYYEKVRIEADAEFEKLSQRAKAVLVAKKAEAEGIMELKKALEGEGGRNLVKMEYAKRLREARIQGTPVLRPGAEFPFMRLEREAVPVPPPAPLIK
jgi:regulator of protease activity HflC (stomatin/prohibitin superfamily)